MKESNLVKFLRFGIYLTAFIPLVIFDDFISPFHFGKVIVFRSLIEILGAGYLILILKDRSYLPRRDKIFWALFLFTLAFSLTTITSALPYPSFWGTLERMGGLWTFFHYFLFFIILTSVLTKKEHWHKLLNLTIFAGVLSAFYGFGQKTNISFFVGSGGRERIFGTIGNTALFAGYELFAAFLSLTMFLKPGGSRRSKSFYLFSFIISSVALLMTAVRGSVLGFGVGLIAFAFLWTFQKNSRAGKLAFNALIGAIALFFVFSFLFSDAGFIQNSRYLRRVTNLSLSSPTVQTRFWAWEAGLKGWKENFKTVVLGWGPENFNIPFSNNFNPRFYAGPGSETLFDRAHNMFVEVLVTMGVVGFLAYIYVFAALFSSLKKKLRDNDSAIFGMGLISALVAYLIHNSFIFDTSANFIVFFTIAGFISNLGFGERKENESVKPIARFKSIAGLLAVGLAIFISILIYKINILPAKANYATTRAIVRGWERDFYGAVEKYKEALSYDVMGKYEYRHRFAQYLVGDGIPSTQEEKVKEIFHFVIGEIDKNIKENPGDYLPYLYGSRLNITLGQHDPKSSYNDKALEYSTKSLELSPTHVRTYFEVAQAYLNKKDYGRAIKEFQKAIELNPDVGISYWYLGMTKLEFGDQSGVKDLEKSLQVEYKYNPNEQELLRILKIYIRSNNFPGMVVILEHLVSTNPENPQYLASLAAAYVNVGRIDDAVKDARKAAELDPSFEAEARAFLKSLGREF